MSNGQRFDDEVWNGPYRSSEKAMDEILRLMKEHKLRFTFNPGGGEFSMPGGGRCQITTYDDVADLETLEAALGVDPTGDSEPDESPDFNPQEES